jgi:hypothetical protein
MQNGEEYEFDVAISYAGEDAAFVYQVADKLRRDGVRVFYAEFALAQTWGSDLVAFFEDIFRNRARYAMFFISVHYVSKPWTRLERRSAQARALVEDEPYILPVRLDDSELPGLLPTVGYLDARQMSIDGLVQLVLKRLGTLPTEREELPPLGVPRTLEQQERLLAVRPAGWEYLLFAGLLAQGKIRLEPIWHDYRLGLVRLEGEPLSDDEAATLLSRAMDVPLVAVENADRLLSEDVQTQAFGPPGTAGDMELILHLGQRFIQTYEDLLTWGHRVRSARVPDELRRLADITGSLVGNALTEIRTFIDHFVAEMEKIPELLRNPDSDPVRLEFHLELTISDEVLAEHAAELKRLRRDSRWR